MKTEGYDELVLDLVKERKAERRWKWIKRGFIVLLIVISFGNAFITKAKDAFGESASVGIVEIKGEIGEGKKAGAKQVIAKLGKAFQGDKYEAIVLDIDSGGGQPQEAERIMAEIQRLNSENPKRIVAVINGVGASAAYMIAMQADEVVAGRYSMVGSIGAVLQTWNLAEVSSKVGVSKVTVTSGKYKDLMNPFKEFSEDDKEKASELVNKMASEFQADVMKSRSGKLKGEGIFSGEVWSGEDAMRLGLVDRIGTLEGELKRLKATGVEIKEKESAIEKVAGSLRDGIENGLSAVMNSAFELRM